MSIFKDSFTSNIRKQLEVRQKAMLARGPNEIQYLNSRNAWVRMTSSVNVNGKPDLAKQYVLLGGILNNGIPKTKIGGWENAYSNISAEENPYRLGLRPLPGITSIDIKSKSAYGSLREVQVNFQCWDIKQLEEIELLYMRPGYTVLVEWGWAPYLDNNGNPKHNVSFYDEVLNGTSTKEQVWEDIYNKANTDGNYDAMFGYVKNYSWSARPDGGYDCQTSVISIGEIIESLKINYSSFNVSGFDKGYFIPKIIGNESTSIKGATQPFPEFLTQKPQDIDTLIMLSALFPSLASTLLEKAAKSAYIQKWQELIKQSYSTNVLAGLFFELYEIGKYTTGKGSENTTQDEGAHITLSDPNISDSSYDLFHVTININNGSDEATKDKTIKGSDEQVYIRLGSLIDLINNYVSLRDEKSNLSLSELTVKERKYDSKLASIGGSIGASITQKNTDNDDLITGEGYLKSLTHPLQLSVDPRVCLIKNPLLNKQQIINTENLSFIQKLQYPYFANNNENNLGIIANIYVSLSLLYNLATDNALETQDRKEKNEISLYDFLKNMMSQISPCIGNVNTFDIHVDPVDNKARIIDINYVDEMTQKDAYENAFLLEIHNLKSTVRSYKLESQITPDQSTVVAIGAQAQGGALGINTNTLVDFNKNLEDRILGAKISPTTALSSTKAATAGAAMGVTKTNTTNTSVQQETLKQNFATLFPFLLDLSYTKKSDRDFDADKADSYKGALRDIIAYFQSIEKSDKTNRAIIPTKLSIEMDGIGGLVIGHIFKIPDDLSPRGYKGLDVGAKIGYVITSIGHSIQPNDWVTKLETQYIMLDEPTGGIKIDYTNIATYAFESAAAANAASVKSTTVKAVSAIDPGPNVEAKNIPYSVDQIIKTMKALNYEVKTTPWYVNVVGIRNKYKQPGVQATDKFIDYMVMWYVDDKGQRFERKSLITTTAGPSFYTGGVTDSFNELVPGQYKDGWELGIHKRTAPSYPALVERTPIKVWRPDTKDGKYKLSGNIISTTPGDNIHRASIGGSSTIGLNSRGCQVFSQPTELQWLVNAVTQQQTKNVNILVSPVDGRKVVAVNYTLLKEEQIIK